MEIHHEQNFKKMRVRTCAFGRGEHSFHWHEQVEIVVCLSKGFGLLVDGVQYEIGAGDIAVVGGQIIHKFDIYEDDTELVIVQVSYEVLLETGMTLTSVQPVITKKEIESVPEFRQKADYLLNIMLNETDSSDDDVFLRHMYAGLYCLLARSFGTKAVIRSGRRKEKDDFYKIVSYVNCHYTENITVQSIAGELYMDRGRLSKLFLKYSGITLNGYINRLRLSLAKKLIEEGMGVTRAALESGFQSLRTYNNVKKNIEK